MEKSGQSEPKQTATVAETIWSKEWCAQEPELASIAIAALQDRIGILEDYIKSREPVKQAEKPRKRRLSINSKAVLLSTLPPDTYFILLRTGEVYRTSKVDGLKVQYKVGEIKASHLHGCSRVELLHDKRP